MNVNELLGLKRPRTDEEEAAVRADDDASIARQKADALYSWELLPAYEWNNRFARTIGRLLAQLPKRFLIHACQLAGQAQVISNCICGSHREPAPGEVLSREERRAYLLIGREACAQSLARLDELSRATALGQSDMRHGRELVEKIHAQLDWELRELDQPALPRARKA